MLTNMPVHAGIAVQRQTVPRVEVSEFRDADAPAWDRFVRESPEATFFHLSGWRRVVAETLGHRSIWYVARRGGDIAGVFPISWIRNKIFGDCLVSCPLAVYGGICAADAESRAELLKAGTDLAKRLGVKYLEMRNRVEPEPSVLPSRDLYVTFTLDLTQGPDKILKAMPRDTRYMIRKTLKSDLEWTSKVELDEFYEVYATSVHRLGTPVFSKRLFASLIEEFGADCRIYGVRKAGQLIAGVLCFYFRDQVLPYYAGSLPEFNRDSPNNFMYWKLIAQSCEEGLREFDFGRSKKGTGSFHFKSAWNMQTVDLPYRYFLVRAAEVPEMSPVDSKFQAPVAIWKKMPFRLTKVLGPRVIRWVPSV
jgi:FemAB-related protein (PEP-CTERM system-associated)